MPSLRRRNGRKAACEACRRRKLACDHNQPTCHRCQKHSLECIYLSQSNRTNCGISEGAPRSLAGSGAPFSEVHATSAENHRVADRSTPLIDSPNEYLGPTSFTSVFVEHGDCFELEDTNRTSEIRRDSAPDPQVDTPLVQLGARILSQIPEEHDCSTLFSSHINPNDGWIRLAGRHSLDRMWDAFRPALRRRSEEDMLETATILTRNSKTPLQKKQDPQAWLTSFTGTQMRWETIGILYTYWACGAVSSSSESQAVARYCQGHSSVTNTKQLMARFKHCALLCIDLCKQLGSVNLLFVYLLYKHNILEGILSGDKSFSHWTQHGELVAVTTSLGLHREHSTETETISLQHELKRRLYAAVFNIDKVISTFTGRPPLLSQAYSSTKLPLDLSDDTLLSGNFPSAAAQLDPNGWNTDNQIYSTTILRSRTSFARIRHEILELLEGSMDNLADGSVDKAMKLKQRTHYTYTQLPSIIQFEKSELGKTNVPGYVLYAQILTRLEFLLNLFLLERLLKRHHIVTEQDLVEVSHEMLDLTLIFWKKKDRFVGLYADFEWLTMSYAVPASGILCLQLLRQAINPHSYQTRLPRSAIIQNLSLLVLCLDWIETEASCRSMVSFIRGILGRSMDRILDADPPGAEQLQSVGSFPSDGLLQYPHLELLNTFDWVDWDGGVGG
ncbi:transcriptional regulator family: Fungal Specific TF [Aspergillus niger]|nr:transcriptional regulator family: Fungal Specific TF [Aspergillus niger]KAI2966601.1 transcriptional regulator family: Fungal Specific TF [Aspergillus niger]